MHEDGMALALAMARVNITASRLMNALDVDVISTFNSLKSVQMTDYYQNSSLEYLCYIILGIIS